MFQYINIQGRVMTKPKIFRTYYDRLIQDGKRTKEEHKIII